MNSRVSGRVWLLLVATLVVLIIGTVVTISLLPPEQSPPVENEEEPLEMRSIVVTDEEVLPLLPLDGARLHFMPGNKIQVGYKSIPIQPIISCGISEGMLWFSGIPSWIDLSTIDQSIDNYLSRWTPSWSFTIDTSATSATSTVTTKSGLCTTDTTPTFNWANIANEDGVKYYLEIANSSDFSSPVLAKSKLRSTSYTLTDEEALVNGNYCWRIMQRGKVWVIGMPPWLDISRYDPQVTELPIIVSIETGNGEVKVNYMI